MKHLKVSAAHRLSMLRGMSSDIIMLERIVTTSAKAKELRSFVEKIITTAKSGGMHSRRQVSKHIKSREAMRKLFIELAPRYKTRPGGYTRILKMGSRQGDGAEMCRVELLK